MFKLTLASFVNTVLLPIIFVKFGINNEISTAIADCNSLPSIENTKNNATGSGPFVDGIIIRFDCDLGFNPAGTSREYRCSGKQWVDGNLRCEEIFCSHVETPENGKVVNVPTYRVGTTIQFECNEGFDLVGSSNKMLCRIDGNWLPLEPPVCNIKMCGEFGSIQFGETFQDNSYIIRNGYGSIVEVTCNEGYIVKGSPHVKCKADGYWGEKPICELSTCPPYPGLNSSCIKDANPFGPYLFINCRDDVPVTKKGPPQAECINGAWDYLNLACYCHCKVEADSQTMSLQNVEKGYLVHDKTLEWSCKNGYEKKMPDTFHCFDGNLIKPECIIKYKPTVEPRPTVKPETTTYKPLKPVTDEFEITIYPHSETKSQVCTPNYIHLTISDDLPKGDNSTRISFFCNNWINISVNFRLDIIYNEHRYFKIENVKSGHLNYFVLTIKNAPPINTWNTHVSVLEEPYKNVTVNRVPIRIDVKEVNDRPTILPDYLITEVPEDVPVGTIVANLSISDPDDGKFGDLQIELKSYTDIDVNGLFEVERISKDTIQIKTASVLDADKFRDSEETYSENENTRGPTFLFDVLVRDGGGLSAISVINVTVIDIGDIEPVCNNPTLYNQTYMTRKGETVTSLDNFCRARNYVSAVFHFQEVTYALSLDSCNLFNITKNGSVQLQNRVPNDIKTCSLTVQALDIVYPTSVTTFSLSIEFRRCLSDTDYRHIQWDTGIPGETSMHKCPTGYRGNVTRYCTKTGIYQDPVYNCTKTSIENIYNKLLDDKKTGQVNIIDVLDELSNETSDTDENSTLLIGDINVAVNTLAQIVDVVTFNTTNLENVTDSYIQTINNILDESTAQTWKVNINQTGSGADVVLKTTDRFVEKILTTSKNVTAEISKSNLYLKMASVQSCNEALNFPEHGKEGVSDWARSRKDGLVIDCDGTVESFSGIMYRNLSLIIPSSTNNTNGNMSEDLQLNAPVISFTFYPNIKRELVSPVEIQFQLYNNSLDNARCSFWKESDNETSQGYWSDEGCRLKKYDKDEEVVVCVCDHLTNFAVLMSPSTKQIEEEHKEALSIISMIGCIVSMICLVLNVAIHAFFWRFIKSVRYIIHMNLSCWLIVAYILFLVGINRTENKDVCTAMAVLLHLVFLIVFFGMLTEGCNLSYTVLKPLSTLKPGMPLMISSYVLAVMIVVISMGASQLQGYGTGQACWLSTETGLIWAFLAPVLVVILVNFIIVVLVIRTMCGTTAMSKKSNKGRAKAALRCILVLMPVMGLTWGFGVLSLNSDTIVFQYIFALLNSFQGLLIFIFHCVMDKKIKDAFSKQRYKWLQSTQSFGVSEGKKSKTQDSSVF